METTAGIAVLLVYLVVYAIMLVFAIAAYVLQAIGMYAIAKRRNISKPVFAWIPVANVWLLGAIADHYDETVKGVKKKSRVILLSLEIATLIIAAIVSVISIIAIVMLAVETYSEALLMGYTIISVVLCIVIIAIAVVAVVFQYIAYYKLFKSCNPDNAVVYLVLSIFVSFALPIIIFISRKSDKGLLVENAVE